MYNFKFKEAIKSDTAERLGIKNTLPNELMTNFMTSSYGIQKVRDLLQIPMRINSWFRCDKVNRAVGGSKYSAHKKALAVDFVPIGMPIETAYQMIIDSDLDYDQLVLEHNKTSTWVHISFDKRNRKQYFKLEKKEKK